MPEELRTNQKALAESVKTSLKKAGELITGRRKRNNRLIVTGITSSAASTLVAGITAAGGPLIGTGTEGWRIACIIAAVFGFTSTLTTGFGQQMKDNPQLAEGTQCLDRLRALNVAITTGNRSWEEIVKEYEDIAQAYPEFIS